MPLIQTQVGPQALSDGAQPIVRAGKLGDVIISELMGRYYEQAYRGNLFLANAIVTAPVIYTTAAGTGGPFIWNSSQTTNVVLLAVANGGKSVATSVAGAIGLTGNTGQSAAPTGTTAIDARTNCKLGGGASAATPYRVATPAVAGGWFFPLGTISTAAVSVNEPGFVWTDLGGSIIVPPNCWVSGAASATLTSLVMQMAFLYTEVPI